jgi:hypothetical protein
MAFHRNALQFRTDFLLLRNTDSEAVCATRTEKGRRSETAARGERRLIPQLRDGLQGELYLSSFDTNAQLHD